MADATTFHLQIITPAEILVDADVPTVNIPGVEGDFGVLPGHCNLFSMIRPGMIDVTLADGSQRRFFVSSGYADVTGARCTILSDDIRDAQKIGPAEIAEALAAARELLAKAQTDFERARAEKQLLAAEALSLALSRHAA